MAYANDPTTIERVLNICKQNNSDLVPPTLLDQTKLNTPEKEGQATKVLIGSALNTDLSVSDFDRKHAKQRQVDAEEEEEVWDVEIYIVVTKRVKMCHYTRSDDDEQNTEQFKDNKSFIPVHKSLGHAFFQGPVATQEIKALHDPKLKSSNACWKRWLTLVYEAKAGGLAKSKKQKAAEDEEDDDQQPAADPENQSKSDSAQKATPAKEITAEPENQGKSDSDQVMKKQPLEIWKQYKYGALLEDEYDFAEVGEAYKTVFDRGFAPSEDLLRACLEEMSENNGVTSCYNTLTWRAWDFNGVEDIYDGMERMYEDTAATEMGEEEALDPHQDQPDPTATEEGEKADADRDGIPLTETSEDEAEFHYDGPRALGPIIMTEEEAIQILSKRSAPEDLEPRFAKKAKNGEWRILDGLVERAREVGGEGTE